MYTGRYVIEIFTAENITVQVLLRHARPIFEEKVTKINKSDSQLNLGQVNSCFYDFATATARQETFQVTRSLFPNV